jgi:hypothetical protein
MKNSKARKKSHAPRELITCQQDLRKLIEFPGIKGRVLDKVQFSTAVDFHFLVLDFQDKTSLTIVIDPCFLISASFSDFSANNEQILRRWPKVQSMSYKD